MLNIEKYKDNILNAAQADITCCVIDLFHNGVCPDNCKDCKKAAMKWILSECKEQILNDAERKYLSNALKPFKKEISTIAKYSFTENYSEKREYIIVRFNDRHGWSFPSFKANTMYKGMDVYKEYTPEELGL